MAAYGDERICSTLVISACLVIIDSVSRGAWRNSVIHGGRNDEAINGEERRRHGGENTSC